MFSAVNSSKLMVGVCILLTNLGGKYIGLELSKAEEKLLQDPVVRRIIVFTMTFVATRDFLVAAVVTLLFMLFVKRGDLLAWSGRGERPEERA